MRIGVLRQKAVNGRQCPGDYLKDCPLDNSMVALVGSKSKTLLPVVTRGELATSIAPRCAHVKILIQIQTNTKKIHRTNTCKYKYMQEQICTANYIVACGATTKAFCWAHLQRLWTQKSKWFLNTNMIKGTKYEVKK